MKKNRLFFLLLISSLVAHTHAQNPARSGKDYAVFFYVTTFQPGWENLPDTELDSRAIAKELEDNYGFQVEFVQNPTRADLRNKFLELNSRKFGDKDQLLLYFTMHGHFNEAADRGYLIPSDGKIPPNDPLGESWLSYDDLGAYISLNPCGHLLLALDACYSGAFGDRWMNYPGNTTADINADCRTKEEIALFNNCHLYFSSGSRDVRVPSQSKFANRWLTALQEGRHKKVINTNELRYYFGTIDNPRPEGGTFLKNKNNGDFVFIHKTACSGVSLPPIDDPASDPDGDNLIGPLDECPDEAGNLNTNGCPDKDGDQVPDKRDACPDQPGIASLNGCPPPDADGDGVPDDSDKCPETFGLAQYNGCPDTDGDGVPDNRDICPDVYGLANLKGCPDSDGDRIPDHIDRCPDKKGTASNNGCPERKIDPDFVDIQGGTFQMGSTESNVEDEKPVHDVKLADFYLGKHEVSNQEFEKFLNAITPTVSGNDVIFEGNVIYRLICSGCDFWEDRILYNNGRFSIRPGYEKHPVAMVTWYGAIAYCNWYNENSGLEKTYTITGTSVTANWNVDGYRLPTEAEWEFAARSRGKNYNYAWGSNSSNGNVADEKAKQLISRLPVWEHYNDGYSTTAPAEKFNQGDLGLCNMTGNVSEWCWDWYSYDYYSNRDQKDPHGPNTGTYRVIRGGSWIDSIAEQRCTSRSKVKPDIGKFQVGFRLARTIR